MKFAEIIREAGLDIGAYPMASKLSIDLYDRKHRLFSSTIHFHENLFAKKESSLIQFKNFLDELEKELHSGSKPSSIDVKITENLVAISADLQSPLIFQRN